MSKEGSDKKSGVTKSKYKVCRRLMTSIWGNAKDPFNTRNTKPGQHGSSSFSRVSDYGLHLIEKQKIKAHYDRTTERQMKNAFKKAVKMKGNSEENFISLLERRLYVLVYRLGFVPTIFAARQFVSHKHITLNGKVVNVPSCLIKMNDKIGLTQSAKNIKLCSDSLSNDSVIPEYLQFDKKNKEGRLTTENIGVADVPFPFKIDMGLVVEFYSK